MVIYHRITLSPVCSANITADNACIVMSDALGSLRIGLKRIEHVFWLQVGYIN